MILRRRCALFGFGHGCHLRRNNQVVARDGPDKSKESNCTERPDQFVVWMEQSHGGDQPNENARHEIPPQIPDTSPENREGEPAVASGHQQDVANLPPAGFHDQIRAGEDRKRHDRDRQADFQRLPHGSHERCVRNARADRCTERRRRRELAPDRQKEHKEVGDPRINSEFRHWRHDDHCANDVGCGRRQAGAEEPAEKIGQQDHCKDVPGADLEHHRSHPEDEARDREQTDHDAERGEQFRKVGGHLGMRFDPAPDAGKKRLAREQGVLAYVFEIEKNHDQHPEHPARGIDRCKQFAFAEEPHQNHEIGHGAEENAGRHLLVERHIRLVDVIARQQAHGKEIDRHANRNVVDEGEPETAQHDVPVRHAEHFRHNKRGRSHHRGVDQRAHRRRGLDRCGDDPW